MAATPHDGRSPINVDGFSYLPQFMSAQEGDALIAFFASLHPIWEQRHGDDENPRAGGGNRRISRPVYWLGAWQFASLGYYAEPDHKNDRCVSGEPFSPDMVNILNRLNPVLKDHDCSEVDSPIPNTCLINYYGSELSEGPPVDQARLRMHRDREPGPVVMICIGQPGLLEFVEPSRPKSPELSVWTRHRSVVIISGDKYKDRLYHRLVRVRHGDKPHMPSPVDNFSLRRVSVSFRHIPDTYIDDADKLPRESIRKIRPYIEELATASPHYKQQLRLVDEAESVNSV